MVQVFAMRGGRVVERVELVAERGTTRAVGRASRRRCMRGGDSAVLRARVPPAEIHLPVGARGSGALESWLASRQWLPGPAAEASRADCRAAARRQARRCVELATRNAAVAYRTRFNEIDRRALRGARDAARRARPAGAAAAHRVLRHLHHPGQRDRGVDGRVRGRPDAAVGYRKFRIRSAEQGPG